MKRLCSALLPVALCLCLSVPALGAEGQSVHATLQSPMIFVEGKVVYFLDHQKGQRNAITYNGTVYIPLTTVGMWMGADTVWNKDSETVTVTSNGAEPVYYTGRDLSDMGVKWLEGLEQYYQDMINGVDVQCLPDVTVTVDGVVRSFANVLGEPTYPILFREEIYLPVRNVAEWMGKGVAWVPYRLFGTVYLCDVPSQETREETSAYLNAVRGRLNAIRTLLTTSVVVSDEEFLTNMRQIQTDLKAVLDLTVPNFPGIAWDVKQVRICARMMLSESVDPYLPVEEASGAAEALGVIPSRMNANFQSWAAQDKWMYVRGATVSAPQDHSTYFINLEENCGYAEAFLTALGG